MVSIAIDYAQGDSGGPLLAADGTQIGITSNGLACGKQGVPSVYTRVSAFSEWILPRLK
jgi:secreted trypsin-like serine protease